MTAPKHQGTFSPIIKPLISTLLTAFLTACGGSSSDSSASSNEEIMTGVFVDSAVEGLRYETATQSGMTNENGEFLYMSGETVTFSLGDIVLPSIPAEAQISPLKVFSTTDYYETSVVNLARLLQTLDTDGNSSNGITLAENLHTFATGLSIDFSAADFDNSVANLVANSGAAFVALIDESQAVNHLVVSLNSTSSLRSCDSTHAKIGQSGIFVSRTHGVSGKTTIINDCTLLITDFSYDGGGPSVYFYGAINHDYSSSEAIRMGDRLNGAAYESDTLVLNLPENRSLDDMDSLSVWCDEFNASFGDLLFSF